VNIPGAPGVGGVIFNGKLDRPDYNRSTIPNYFTYKSIESIETCDPAAGYYFQRCFSMNVQF
jgi:hypothetical protein